MRCCVIINKIRTKEKGRNMYHFLVNPTASSGKSRKVWREIKKVLREEKVPHKLHILKNSNQATELAKNLSSQESEEHIVVLGGDGTLNAVLQGIESFKRVKLSCIRTGSGNDFAKDMGIIKNPKKAMKHLLLDEEETVLDYGKIYLIGDEKKEQKRFLISSGVGYDADICEEVSRSKWKKRLNRLHLGKLIYVAIGIKQIFTRKSVPAVICMDDEEPLEITGLFFIVGMVHRFEGGGIPFCPNADATDGFLDVCLAKKMPKWKLCLAVALVYAKKHYLFKNITEHRCKSLTVTLDEPQWFHMDGETPFKVDEITMECRQGLRFCK